MNENAYINDIKSEKYIKPIAGAYQDLKHSDVGVPNMNGTARIDVKELLTHIRTKGTSIYSDLEYVLTNMIDWLKTIETDPNIMHFELFNLPKMACRPISDIRSKDINAFIQLKGKIISKSNLLARTCNVKYTCGVCQKEAQIKPDPFTFDSPKETIKCMCGRGKLAINSLEMEDMVYLKLEETTEDTKLENPESIIIAIKGHHTTMKNLKRFKLGADVNLTGVLQLRKLDRYKQGDFVLIVNSIEYLNEDKALKLTEDDKKLIGELKTDPLFMNKLIGMVDEDVLGYSDIKESLLYFLVGAEEWRKSMPMINVLMVGEPGTAKSQLAKSAEYLGEKVRFTSGKNSSGAGLTAGILKDESMGGQTIKLGAIPLSNKGHVIVDEMDKLQDNDKSSLLQAMSLGIISLSKIKEGTFEAKTAILGIANPREIKFNARKDMYDQLGFGQDLFSRFEFIWIIKNEVDEVRDSAIAGLLVSHAFKENIDNYKEPEFLKKYIKYVKNKFHPTFTTDNESSVKGAKDLQTFFVKTRGKDVNLTARFINAGSKVACAHAKLRQSNVIEEIDVVRATEILSKSLEGLR